MNDPLYNALCEGSWRRRLSPEEAAELRAWLAAHPEMESDWEIEEKLSEALRRLPDAEVPSNFTAQVLSRVSGTERGLAGSRPVVRWRWIWRSLLPKAAVGTMAVALVVIAYGRHQAAQRTQLARNIATVSRVAAVPGAEVLRDFEAIRRLGLPPAADDQLLALLQ